MSPAPSKIIFDQGLQEVASPTTQTPSPLPIGSHSRQVKYFQAILYFLLHPSQLGSHLQAFTLDIPCPSPLDAFSAISHPFSPLWRTTQESGISQYFEVCGPVSCSITGTNKLCWTYGALSREKEQLQVDRPFWLLGNLSPDCLFPGAPFPGS